MRVPRLQDQGKGRGPAPVLALLDERHVKPDSRAFLRRGFDWRPQEKRQE